MEEEDKSIIKSVIAIVVIVVLFIVGVIIVLAKIDFSGTHSGSSVSTNSDDFSTSSVDNNALTNGEAEIDDYDLSQLLYERTNYLFRINSPQQNPLFKGNISAKDLADVYMISLAIEVVSSNYSQTSYCFNSNTQSLSTNCSGSDGDIEEYVNISDVTSAIKSYFGRDFTPQNYYQSCPSLALSSDKTKLFLINNCNKDGYNEEIQYIYKMTEKDGKYYVYVAYGLFVNQNGNYTLYTDYEGKNKYSKEATYNNFVLEEANYNEFSKYKMTFYKNGNDFVFEKIEKLGQ